MPTTSTIATSGPSSRPRCFRTSSTGTSSARISTATDWSAPTSRAPRRQLLLEPVAGPEHPRDHRHAQGDDRDGDQHARPYRHVRNGVEAPAEAADHVDDRVEQGDRPEGIVE